MVQVNSRPTVQGSSGRPSGWQAISMDVVRPFSREMRPHSVVTSRLNGPSVLQVAELFAAVVLDQGLGQREQVTLNRPG